MRDFIWLGDIENIKLITLDWNKICKHRDEEGSALRSIKTIYNVAILLLTWNYLISDKHLVILLRAYAKRGSGHTNYHIESSIWFSIKSHLHII